MCRESRFLRDPDDEIPPSFLHFFLFAFIAEHRQSKILTTRKKTLGNCKETSGVLAAVPCRPSGTFWDGWDLSLPTLAGKWFLEERVHCTNYVHPFCNTNCLELKFLHPNKFKTVPSDLCPEHTIRKCSKMDGQKYIPFFAFK